MTLNFAVCSFRTTMMTMLTSCIVVDAGVSAADKQKGWNEGGRQTQVGKKRRARKLETVKSHGGVSICVDRRDRTSGVEMPLSDTAISVGGLCSLSRLYLSFLSFSSHFLPFYRVFSTAAISQDLVYHR